MAQFIDLYINPTGVEFQEGYAHWEAVTIGGQTPDGEDATNDLTYLFLESKREFPLNYPDLAARIHSRSPERFLREVALTIKDGSGFPKLINDEEVVFLNTIKGCPVNEALDYAVSGCTETRMGRANFALQRPDAAVQALQESLALLRATMGPTAPMTLGAMQNLAHALLGLEKVEESLDLGREALRLTIEACGADSPQVAEAQLRLSSAYYRKRDFDRAESLMAKQPLLPTRWKPIRRRCFLAAVWVLRLPIQPMCDLQPYPFRMPCF